MEQSPLEKPLIRILSEKTRKLAAGLQDFKVVKINARSRQSDCYGCVYPLPLLTMLVCACGLNRSKIVQPLKSQERKTDELVAMSEFNLNSLCPSCRKIIRLPTPIGVQGIICPHCRALYSKTAGFLDFLPYAPSGQSVAQTIVEWPRFIRAYEGKYWRKSIFLAFFLAGITFSDEFDLITKAADLSGTEVILDLACGLNPFLC